MSGNIEVKVSEWNEETDNIVGLHVVGKGLFKLVKGNVSKGEATKTQKYIKEFECGYTDTYKRKESNDKYSVWQRILHEYEMKGDEKLIGKYIHYTVPGLVNQFLTSRLNDKHNLGAIVLDVFNDGKTSKKLLIVDNEFVNPHWIRLHRMNIVKIEEVTKEHKKPKPEKTKLIKNINENDAEKLQACEQFPNKKETEILTGKQQKHKQQLTNTKHLAILLHEEMCTHNHKNECNWYKEKYKPDIWNEPNHKKYIELANKMRATGIADADIIAIIKEGIEL